nr:histidine kinase [Marinilactibacillus kalidii]
MKQDYNLLKRTVQQQESTIRQEERNQIARELHDAVGHRLTALLMQLEVARIQSQDDENKERLEGFKKLAQLSLQDTRKAVSTLQSDEQSGLQAVIYLIRKLESESHLRLSITLNAGVLNQHLTNTQSVVLYRALQEALTNMMKHSHTRQAKIIFEIVAQRELRFKICHKINNAITIKEGFGLKNMRERIETINGKLEYEVNNDLFELTGQFPVEVIHYD